jgi:predicted lipid-binding transport protein (Tim44 family)
MKIAKPLLLVSTPIGVAGGLYEAFRLAGGLAFIMLALVAVIGAAMAMLVTTIRRERREELAQAQAALPPSTNMSSTSKYV